MRLEGGRGQGSGQIYLLDLLVPLFLCYSYLGSLLSQARRNDDAVRLLPESPCGPRRGRDGALDCCGGHLSPRYFPPGTDPQV